MAEENLTCIIQCQHHSTGRNCSECGIFINKDIQTYKTQRYACDPHASNKRHLKSIRTALKKFHVISEIEKDPEVVYDFLESIVLKFEFSLETFSLGVYFYNQLVNRKTQNYEKCLEQFEFYSSACLMVAAKAIELDKNIPYYSRYQRYADKYRSKEEYEQLEKEIFNEFDFDIQVPTFMTLLSYYLNNGILFQNDNISKEMAWELEDKVFQIGQMNIRNGQFLKMNQQRLAAKIILQARQQFDLDWNPLISEYCQIPMQQVMNPEQQLQECQLITFQSPRSMKSCKTSFTKSTTPPSKIDMSAKLTQRILKQNTSLKATSILPAIPFRSLNNFN